jgi:two-component system alkaline phosphatase synthesis response regulator PhoP
MRILLVEDEKSIQDVVALNLELEGYELEVRGEGKEALKVIEEEHFDLIILDVMLPDISGLQVCESIRLKDDKTPIIILSAKDTSSDRIKGLKSGADDYLIKPFNLEELQLRVEKLLQRSQVTTQEINEFSFGSNYVDLTSYHAKGVDGEFELTNREALLLKLFIERKQEVLSRQQILQIVWGYDVYPSTRTVDNFVMALRKYFEENPRTPKYFHSIRGVGYKFTP